MKKLLLVLSICTGCYCAQANDWTETTGIPSEVSVNSLQLHDNHIYAGGTKMWREGNLFKSEPALFQSVDGGVNWESVPYPTCSILSSYSFLFFHDHRLIASGRKGETQMQWIGALCVSDDNGATWIEATGIPSDVSIGKLLRDGNNLIACGQKQWQEGYTFLAEPHIYISKDNGSSWEENLSVTSELSSIGAAVISAKRMIVAGRLGQAQIDWHGAVFYTDDNGQNWQKSTGIPEEINISTFVVLNNKIIALGNKSWSENYVFHSLSKAFVSYDNGQTWEDWGFVPSELSSISAAIVYNNIIFTAGRKGDVQIDWVGALYSNTIQ